ncbi:MAG: DUF5317 family protein [Actinomycetota bacterium]
MLLLVVAVLVGLVAGWLRPPLGTFTARPRFSWLPLLGAGAALNLAAYVLEGRASTFALMASLALLVGFAGVNAHVTGVAVIGVGLLANFVAVALHDGMPVRGDALVAAGVVDEGELGTVSFAGARHLETSADRLPVLGDVLPVPLPLAPEVLSFGDLIVVLGAADAVRDLVRRRHRRPVRAAVDGLDAPSVAEHVVDLDAQRSEPPNRPLRGPEPSQLEPAAVLVAPSSPPRPTPAVPLDPPPAAAPSPRADASRRPRRFTGPGEPARPLATPAATR